MTSDDNSPARRHRRGQATSSMQFRFPSNRKNRDTSKPGDRVPGPEVHVPSPTEGPGPPRAKVFKALVSWRLRENPDARAGMVNDWNTNPYGDAPVIFPSGHRRSNRLRLAKGKKDVGFASFMMNVEIVYREFVSDTDSHRHCKN